VIAVTDRSSLVREIGSRQHMIAQELERYSDSILLEVARRAIISAVTTQNLVSIGSMNYHSYSTVPMDSLVDRPSTSSGYEISVGFERY
jgi:predicted polyphosphate/ATP-dependent NAD kinase